MDSIVKNANGKPMAFLGPSGILVNSKGRTLGRMGKDGTTYYNANGAKKADPPVQQNDQRGYEHGGMNMDSTHQGMGGNHGGMDTIHRGMNHGKKGTHKGNN